MIEENDEMPPQAAADKEVSGGRRPSACSRCYFCGGAVYIEYALHRMVRYLAECKNCGASGPVCKAMDEAAEKWNAPKFSPENA